MRTLAATLVALLTSLQHIAAADIAKLNNDFVRLREAGQYLEALEPGKELVEALRQQKGERSREYAKALNDLAGI